MTIECGLPPEYCTFGQKDASACKDWLQNSHPALYKEVYGEDASTGAQTAIQAQKDSGADGGDDKDGEGERIVKKEEAGTAEAGTAEESK